MHEFSSPPPESISHKQLNSLLAAARRQPLGSENSIDIFSQEQKSFDQLLINWSSLSQQLLDELRTKSDYILEGREPESLLALGVLEAHLNMAIQAHKASN